MSNSNNRDDHKVISVGTGRNPGERLVEAGSTPGLVTLCLAPAGKEQMFIMRMLGDEGQNPENRWNLDFVQALHKAMTYVKEHTDEGSALLTTTGSWKFWSNGADLAWGAQMRKEGKQHLVAESGSYTLPNIATMLEINIPTVACISGHAFGIAGVLSLAHDNRIQRNDRGWICVNEPELGDKVGPPTLQLIRSAMSDLAFHDTVLCARRWTGPEAKEAGFVSWTGPMEELEVKAIAFTIEKAKNPVPHEMYAWLKARTPRGHAARALRMLIATERGEPNNVGKDVTRTWTAVYSPETGPQMEAVLATQETGPGARGSQQQNFKMPEPHPAKL